MNVDVIDAIHPRATYRLTVDQYHQMVDTGVLVEGARLELIEGVIVAMSPHSPEHARALLAVLKVLNRALAGDSWSVRPQLPLTLARSEPEPDIAVVSVAIAEAAVRHPTTALLVVEIARSSLAVDRAMAAVYAEAGVTEYWIVDVDHRCVELYREPAGGTYRVKQVVGEDATLQPAALPSVAIPVAALFGPPRH